MGKYGGWFVFPFHNFVIAQLSQWRQTTDGIDGWLLAHSV